MNANFEKMCRRSGAYSMPWLIHLYDEDSTVNLYFVNDTVGWVYDGHTYVASTFSYLPGADSIGFDGGGSLDITVLGNELIELIETYRGIKLDVTGVLQDDGAITPVRSFMNHYGTVSWNGKSARFNFEPDDRLSMTFPALIFNSYNCRGVI